MDDAKDQEKSVIEKFGDVVSAAVGLTKAAVMPSREPDVEAIAEKTKEQMLLAGDAAVAVEAVPAPVQKRKRTVKRKATKAVKMKATEPTKKAKIRSRKSAPKATRRMAAKKPRSSQRTGAAKIK